MNAENMLKAISGEFEDVNLKETGIDEYFDFFVEITRRINDKVILKDNILLNKILPDTARMTKDLDMSVFNKEVYEEIKIILHEKGRELTEFSGKYEVKDEIHKQMSGGMTVYDTNNNNQVVFSVDVSFSNNINDFIKTYNFDNILFNGSTIEKIISDKCLATLSRKRFRRVKDFYDLYIISESVEFENIDYLKVVNSMKESFTIDELKDLVNNYPFSEVILEQISKAWDKLKLTNFKTGREILKPRFKKVYDNITVIYNELKRFI